VALAKKVEQPSAEQREQALLADIHALLNRLNRYLDERATELKAGRDGAGIPTQHFAPG
jgi:hypothetical protein